MAAKKGHIKSGGREKGSANKVTQTARELFVEILEGQVPKIKEAFEKVWAKSPEKYLELYAKYAQYFIPRKVDITTKDEAIDQTFIIGGQVIKF